MLVSKKPLSLGGITHFWVVAIASESQVSLRDLIKFYTDNTYELMTLSKDSLHSSLSQSLALSLSCNLKVCSSGVPAKYVFSYFQPTFPVAQSQYLEGMSGFI